MHGVLVCKWYLDMAPVTEAAHSDRTGERFVHHCWPWWGVMIAYIIGASTTSIGARYFAMFLMAAGYSGENYSNSISPKF